MSGHIDAFKSAATPGQTIGTAMAEITAANHIKSTANYFWKVGNSAMAAKSNPPDCESQSSSIVAIRATKPNRKRVQCYGTQHPTLVLENIMCSIIEQFH